MADDTPEHRTSVTQRSGDTHVIGEDGALRNVDAEARASLSRRPAAEGAGGTNAATSGGVMPPAEAAQATKTKPAAKAD